MRILVTGATGFLGTKICEILADQNDLTVFKVSRTARESFIELDLLSRKNTVELITEIKPEVVVHCAAAVPSGNISYDDETFFLNNIEMAKNLCVSSNCKIIHISSMTVYGESEKAMRAEADAGEPQSVYGQSKFACEQYFKGTQKNIVAARIPGLYSRDRTGGLVNSVAGYFRGDVSESELSLPENPLIWAAMHVRDAAQIISELIHVEPKGFLPINVSYGGAYSINLLVKYVAKYFKKSFNYNVNHPEFEFDLRRLNNQGVPFNGVFKEKIIQYLKEFDEN